MTHDKQLCRVEFPTFVEMPTRWMDNDVFGHINNVNYYSFFDTAINLFLIESGHEFIADKEIAFYAVHSSCNFLSSIAYPESVSYTHLTLPTIYSV